MNKRKGRKSLTLPGLIQFPFMTSYVLTMATDRPYIGPKCVEKWIGSLSNNDGDGYENVTLKVSRAALNFIAFIPSRSIRQMLAVFSGVEF